MKETKEQNTNKGITLIALVITIIVILILVAVSITMAVNGGLFEYASKASRETNSAIENEQELVDLQENMTVQDLINKYTGVNREYIGKEDPEKDLYVGYYADIDGNGTVDGIIYADLAFEKSGQWMDSNGSYTIKREPNVKDYYVSKESYTTKAFGENPVLTADGDGNNRFYVMALSDFGTLAYWYYNAKGNMSDYNTATSVAFGTGEANTAKMIGYWKDEKPYGKQNTNDMWGKIQEQVKKGWFVPSRGEWAAFVAELGIDLSKNLDDYELNTSYFSSSQNDTENAWSIDFVFASMYSGKVDTHDNIRLSTTF